MCIESQMWFFIYLISLLPNIYPPPPSNTNLICRFLRLLYEHDWTFSPLIVDINGDLSPDEEKEINVSTMVLVNFFLVAGVLNDYMLFPNIELSSILIGKFCVE